MTRLQILALRSRIFGARDDGEAFGDIGRRTFDGGISQGILPGIIDGQATFRIYPHQGKQDLLGKLEARLRGYRPWLPANYRIVVLVDRDDDDCNSLKGRLERISHGAGLRSRSAAGGLPWQVVNRIAIEELEAWYFGDWNAVRRSYPRVAANVPGKAAYRQPDAIAGGTWEALERILKRAGYFTSGLRKIEIGRILGKQVDPAANRSPSFVAFRDALLRAVS